MTQPRSLSFARNDKGRKQNNGKNERINDKKTKEEKRKQQEKEKRHKKEKIKNIVIARECNDRGNPVNLAL